METHQVITGINYHNKLEHGLCLHGMPACLEAPQLLAASPRYAEGEPQPWTGITATLHRA